VLNKTVNELNYNPPGSEEGFLFWLLWYVHNGNSIVSIEDAHGAAWRGLVMIGCSTLGQVLAANPALAPLALVPLCPASPKTTRAAQAALAKLKLAGHASGGGR
jgi:phospholipid/cholesterol/gamma-HCH transport system substrate-binding protein